MKIQNTKSKLFIIQLLNFMRISYMAGKAKHVGSVARAVDPLNRFCLQYKITNCPNIT